MASLPSKRSPASSPEGMTSPKKTKAEKKRESIARAKEWATERKRKKEGPASDDAKKHKAVDEGTEDVVAGEESDVLENLPSPSRSRKSNKSDDISISESSVGSRRSTRRRTMNAKGATAASASSTRSKAGTRKSRKNDEEVKPTNVEEKVAEEVEDAAEAKVDTPRKHSRGRAHKDSSITPKAKTPIAVKSDQEEEA